MPTGVVDRPPEYMICDYQVRTPKSPLTGVDITVEFGPNRLHLASPSKAKGITRFATGGATGSEAVDCHSGICEGLVIVQNSRSKWFVVASGTNPRVIRAFFSSFHVFSQFVLKDGVYKVAVSWHDANTATFKGTVGGHPIAGNSSYAPPFAFVASGTFEDYRFKVRLTMGSVTAGTVLKVNGKVGTMTVTGVARIEPNFSTLIPRLSFSGTVDGRAVTGMLPLNSSVGLNNHATGTVRVG